MCLPYELRCSDMMVYLAETIDEKHFEHSRRALFAVEGSAYDVDTHPEQCHFRQYPILTPLIPRRAAGFNHFLSF